MQAARIHAFGDAGVLRVEEVPEPALRGGDILVRVAASGVNPIEWKIREGGMARALGRALPVTLGWECAGVVERVGPAAAGFRPGDEVFAYPEFTREGTHAALVAMDAAQAAHRPPLLSAVEAAAVPMTAQAAWTALETAAPKPGERVLVHGAAGAVGHWVVQMAKLRGAEVIATASGPGLETVRALGADRALDYRTERFEEAGPVDVVVDLVGGETQARSLAVLGAGARLVSTVQPSPPGAAEARGGTAAFIFTPPRGAVLAGIARLLGEGALRPLPVGLVLPLAEARRAHELAQAGRAGGKAVLVMG